MSVLLHREGHSEREEDQVTHDFEQSENDGEDDGIDDGAYLEHQEDEALLPLTQNPRDTHAMRLKKQRDVAVSALRLRIFSLILILFSIVLCTFTYTDARKSKDAPILWFPFAADVTTCIVAGYGVFASLSKKALYPLSVLPLTHPETLSYPSLHCSLSLPWGQ